MLNDTGYHRPTYEEILEAKIQRAKELFGDDINTEGNTAFGKFIRLGAYDLAQAYEDVEAVYYARFPNTATGVSLDRLCVFAGISRNPPTASQHIVRVYSTEDTETATEIGIGELVVCGDDADIIFYTANNYSVPAHGGSVDVVVECATAGKIGNVASITEIVNPIATIDRIEYVGVEEKGEDAESDYDLRKRFAMAIEGSGSSNINAIRAAIMRVPTVKSASIIANNTDATVDGRPPFSFECYVYGGNDYEDKIAEAIFDKAPIGIRTCSTSKNPVTETVRDDGGYPHEISFSHTEEVEITVTVSYKKSASFPEDGEEQIKTIISTYINNLGVGADVILTSLYGRVYSVAGVEDVTSITLATAGGAGTAANISVEAWQVPQTSMDKVVLEVVK